jgi:ribonuclease HII
MIRRKSSDASVSIFDLQKRPDFLRERALIARGEAPVAGVDEVGRGPLAGPVLAAAVVLDPDRIPDGLHDSKRLTARRREELFEAVLATAHVAIASVSHLRIDGTDIRKACLEAMRRAVAALPVRPRHVLVDGRDMPDLPCAGEALVAGDARSLSIAAASIVAKVSRDRMMDRLCLSYPVYGFSAHKGYAAARHRAAIAAHGPCPFHRLSFSPFRTDESGSASTVD